jgi:hypothetical protein
MNETEFSSLFVPNKILDNSIPSPQSQIIKAENCFNPLIVILRLNNSIIDISAIEYNQKYFEPLTNLREAIESRDLESVILAVNGFHYSGFSFNHNDQNFIDFLTFRGLFYNCQWFKNADPVGFPQDLICSEEEKPKQMELIPFLKCGERPKDKFQELFEGREDIETEKIGGLKFRNPFSVILCGKYSVEYKDFENAIECLKNGKFISKWREQQDGLKKNQPANGVENKSPQEVIKTLDEVETVNKDLFEITEATKAFRLKMGNETDFINKGIASKCLCNLITHKSANQGLTVDQIRNQSKLIEVREAQEKAKTNIIDEILSQNGRNDILKRIDFLNEKENDTGTLTEDEEIEKNNLVEELSKATNQGKVKKVFTGIQEVKNRERESTQTAIKRALKELQNLKINEYLDKNIVFERGLFYYKGKPFELTTTE